jgi:hypothetical protein
MALVTKKSMKASLKFIHSYQRTCGLRLPTFVPSHKTVNSKDFYLKWEIQKII